MTTGKSGGRDGVAGFLSVSFCHQPDLSGVAGIAEGRAEPNLTPLKVSFLTGDKSTNNSPLSLPKGGRGGTGGAPGLMAAGMPISTRAVAGGALGALVEPRSRSVSPEGARPGVVVLEACLGIWTGCSVSSCRSITGRGGSTEFVTGGFDIVCLGTAGTGTAGGIDAPRVISGRIGVDRDAAWFLAEVLGGGVAGKVAGAGRVISSIRATGVVAGTVLTWVGGVAVIGRAGAGVGDAGTGWAGTAPDASTGGWYIFSRSF